MPGDSTALRTDQYELTMLASALTAGSAIRRCTFEVFARGLRGHRYGIVAGVPRLLDAEAVVLETLVLSVLNHDCAVTAAARMATAAGDRPSAANRRSLGVGPKAPCAGTSPVAPRSRRWCFCGAGSPTSASTTGNSRCRCCGKGTRSARQTRSSRDASGSELR